MQEYLSQSILSWADSSFKYILIFFNLMTLVVVYVHKQKQKHKQQHHVLFITAHPDDEAMFFRPVIRSIAKDYFVHLLCLSGKGTQREEQLKQSAKWLNIHKLQCISNEQMKDSMTSQWPSTLIQQIVFKYVSENSIKAIFTFDSYGVSGHINHRSIAKALQELEYSKKELKLLNKKPQKLIGQESKKVQQIKQKSIKIYHLNSVNIIRKYTGPLEILIALVKDFSWINLNLFDAYHAMSLHQSQFIWYRKLWVFFSQYSYFNSFAISRIKVNHINSSVSNQNSNEQKQQQKKNVTKISEDESKIETLREKYE